MVELVTQFLGDYMFSGSESELDSAVTCEQDDELTSAVPALTATQVYDYTAATQVHVLPAAV